MTTIHMPPQHYTGFEQAPIGMAWRQGAGGEVLRDLDPWSGETILEIAEADLNDLEEAITAAATAQSAWAQTPPSLRAQVMRRAGDIASARHDEIIDWLVREAGSTIAKSEVEWAVVVGGFYEAAGMPTRAAGSILPSDIPGKESRVYRKPIGVVGLISPWDFPIYLTNRTLAPALALGNAVVLKPSAETPVTGGLLLAKILEEAGLPPGLLSVLVGTGTGVGDAIVTHRVPRVISFTGSTATGEIIAQRAGIKRLCFELGGNAPFVVLDDAVVTDAVEAALFGSFFNSGQICMSANRIIVDSKIHDEFVDQFVHRTRELKVGDPSDPATALGPIINGKQLTSIIDKVTRARGDGATHLVRAEPGGPSGLLLGPQVLLGTNAVATAREEVFGPVATIIRADGEAEALSIANDTEYGLSSAVFTSDRERGLQFALGIDAGMTHVNDSPVNEEDNTPYGGEKQSGLGRFGGEWAISEFTTVHWISVQREPRQFPF